MLKLIITDKPNPLLARIVLLLHVVIAIGSWFMYHNVGLTIIFSLFAWIPVVLLGLALVMVVLPIYSLIQLSLPPKDGV